MWVITRNDGKVCGVFLTREDCEATLLYDYNKVDTTLTKCLGDKIMEIWKWNQDLGFWDKYL